ncbi:hypothetical protein [Halodesulfovibrio marinisediminis]|uniref:Uncharacterized protein n=1 Tax=Halodesulfovibrio marinisediminis DSM 17456 TaxID=1121457 RepID=A0A1N6I9I0_9BACT|nr:hypothetical protein [Halodesulfovibrio marinisediminis]SIO28688.1 hypothetical protein SAMN02745161_2547 [Halodesulfovibrio marinisediminis DSM 17456]
MSMNVDKMGGLSGVGNDVVGGKSLSRMFAELQMMASDNAKRKAKDLMDTIKTKQTRLKDAYACKQALQELQSKSDNDDKTVSPLHANFKDSSGKLTNAWLWMPQNGIKNPKLVMKKDDVKAAIARINTHIESLGTDTQTQMIRLQDFMGQYNNFLQGAHKAIGDGKQTLNAILSR